MALPEGLVLEVTLDSEDWQSGLPDYEEIAIRAINQIVSNVPEGKKLFKFSHLELEIILCDDARIKNLNSKYRHQDKATNVLSFEGLNSEQTELLLKSDAEAPSYPVSLGEVYVAYETLAEEAEAAKISLKDHFTHLVIHGILHLLSYDHIEDEEAAIMENVEKKLLLNLAIDDPYAA